MNFAISEKNEPNFQAEEAWSALPLTNR